jgi:hypothetical protein
MCWACRRISHQSSSYWSPCWRSKPELVPFHFAVKINTRIMIPVRNISMITARVAWRVSFDWFWLLDLNI